MLNVKFLSSLKYRKDPISMISFGKCNYLYITLIIQDKLSRTSFLASYVKGCGTLSLSMVIVPISK